MKYLISGIIVILIAYLDLTASQDSSLTRLQDSIKVKENISTIFYRDSVNLCDEYSGYIPDNVCSEKLIVGDYLATPKLSMEKHGDIKAKFQTILKNCSFIRNEEMIYTVDTGWQFYRCEEWVSNNVRLTLHIIGINEGPGGWWFFGILTTTPIDSNKLQKFKGIGF
jgi:hypothetical protein